MEVAIVYPEHDPLPETPGINRCREKEASLPVDELFSKFSYDPKAGNLINNRTGKRAGYTDVYGYRVVCIDGRHFREHRMIWAMAHGAWPDGIIDHVDRDRGNNKLENLRESGLRLNALNSEIQANNTSGFIGVTHRKSRDRWVARVVVNGRRLTVGAKFRTAQEAAGAREKFIKELANDR